VAEVGASPYSTGGGGVTLEHTYAACLLAAVLAGDPIAELGDQLKVSSVKLQASDVSPIDDIVVEGYDRSRVLSRVSIGVRRDPRLVRSEESSVPLIRDYLRIVTEHWADVSRGTWSMALVVATARAAPRELGELAALAHSAPDPATFVSMVARPGAINTSVKSRLDHVTDLVKQAASDLPNASALSSEELTWRLLSRLKVRALRLEGADTSDRTTAVAALRRVVADESLSTADSMLSRIVELTAAWAARGAVITEAMLRRELRAYGLRRSSSYVKVWELLDRLAVRLRDSIRPGLGRTTEPLELERAMERARLETLMKSISDSGGSIVVTGEPDVGKSALSLRVLEKLHGEGVSVASLSLRDLPVSVTDFEDQLGGIPLDDVLSGGEVQPRRLLLIDGSESVREGKSQIFQALTAAALKAGLGVVAVTRTDGAKQVGQDLLRASEIAGLSATPAEHVVGPLAEDERQSLSATFSALKRLNGDDRAQWLLGRPGLVDALLRTGKVVEPTDALSEADVFSAVWRDLVRSNERHDSGTATADDREEAALRVARKTLGLSADSAPGTARAELRSDGVLRLPLDPALSRGEEFSTDLFRDFSLCRLFIRDGWEPLAQAQAPRRSIRAARLACQASLMSGNRQRAWAQIVQRFNQMAIEEGDRWAEVPYEALLTLGDAESAIYELWTNLGEDDHRGLKTLLRLARLRYIEGTFGDPFALAPVIQAAFVGRPALDRSVRMGRSSLTEVKEEIVLAWLRGMVTADRGKDELRQKVRDAVLEANRPCYDDFSVEALATLGPDMDDRSEAWLRNVAEQRPSRLNPAVESVAAALGLSASHPQLMLFLAESYYIERADPEDTWASMRSLDDGIRDYMHGSGIRGPQAAWYYGPFFRLLKTVPLDAIAFINRLLNHAAAFRVRRRTRYGTQHADSDEQEGLYLNVSCVGPRHYVGDTQVWAWYRGTSVGPYPCMSALLALERFIDYLHEKLSFSAEAIIELLMKDCHNLAVPGLLVGFLTRHPEATGTLLDPFLEHPEVWHLETSRVTGDYGFRVRDPDADKLTGTDKRRNTGVCQGE
jgi:hypothetical protein